MSLLKMPRSLEVQLVSKMWIFMEPPSKGCHLVNCLLPSDYRGRWTSKLSKVNWTAISGLKKGAGMEIWILSEALLSTPFLLSVISTTTTKTTTTTTTTKTLKKLELMVQTMNYKRAKSWTGYKFMDLWNQVLKKKQFWWVKDAKKSLSELVLI